MDARRGLYSVDHGRTAAAKTHHLNAALHGAEERVGGLDGAADIVGEESHVLVHVLGDNRVKGVILRGNTGVVDEDVKGPPREVGHHGGAASGGVGDVELDDREARPRRRGEGLKGFGRRGPAARGVDRRAALDAEARKLEAEAALGTRDEDDFTLQRGTYLGFRRALRQVLCERQCRPRADTPQRHQLRAAHGEMRRLTRLSFLKDMYEWNILTSFKINPVWRRPEQCFLLS